MDLFLLLFRSSRCWVSLFAAGGVPSLVAPFLSVFSLSDVGFGTDSLGGVPWFTVSLGWWSAHLIREVKI